MADKHNDPMANLFHTFAALCEHLASTASHASGFALRFPRILRIRTDKPLDEIDTLERVEEIYQSQPDKPVE